MKETIIYSGLYFGKQEDDYRKEIRDIIAKK